MSAAIGVARAPSVATVLEEACGGSAAIGRVVGEQTIKRTVTTEVYRVRLDVRGRSASVVLKRMDPVVAHRNYLVVTRWLPAIGMSDASPRLLGVAAERPGDRVWHVYEDAGDGRLDRTKPDHVAAAVELIARLHTAASAHPLLPECRHHGGDRGIHYFSSNVRDALHGLECLRPPAVQLSRDAVRVRDRLIGRMRGLLAELPQREALIVERGGAETLLHGDLWTNNVLVVSDGDALRARLVDWDHAAVGPVSYDVSTFLYRFPARERAAILRRYERAVNGAGGRLPAPAHLNVLFETAECARYANRIIWPAVALRVDGADWALAELAEVSGWFEELRPVLPDVSRCAI